MNSSAKSHRVSPFSRIKHTHVKVFKITTGSPGTAHPETRTSSGSSFQCPQHEDPSCPRGTALGTCADPTAWNPVFPATLTGKCKTLPAAGRKSSRKVTKPTHAMLSHGAARCGRGTTASAPGVLDGPKAGGRLTVRQEASGERQEVGGERGRGRGTREGYKGAEVLQQRRGE